MKKWILLLTLSIPLICCDRNGGGGEKDHQRDSLDRVIAMKDSVINDVFMSLSIVSENLDAIKSREKLIDHNLVTEGQELQKSTVGQINQDIDAINQLLVQNRETIAKLQRSADALKGANIKISGMEALIGQLTRQVKERDQEISLLQSRLQAMSDQVTALDQRVSGLNTEVKTLSEERANLAGAVKDKTDILNTGYYIVGSEKELIDKEIIYKRGFVGRTLKINEDRNLESFTQVDMRHFNDVLIGQKRVTLVSTHPSESYEWVMGSNGLYAGLRIVEKDRFWEYSKVMVISYK